MITLRTCAASPSTRLFPSFFLGGFECSTPINGDGVRIDELALTEHDFHVRADYHGLRGQGILTARDGIRWNLIDEAGKLDFASALPFIEAAEEEEITVIWDLFHYGYPEDLDPFREPFVARFRDYCRAVAKLLVRRGHGGDGPRFYTPVNEISFFAWAGGEVGKFAPHATGRGPELKRRLAEAAIAGINAIREVDPGARFVNCDPLVHVVAPADAPWLEDEANYFNAHFVCEAWDILAGRIAPELGGSMAHLDILGVNYYGLNQWEHQRPENVLAEDDPRRMPFAQLLRDLYARYEVPMIVSETSSCGEDRARWMEYLAEQCLEAMADGVDMQGICVYPVIGMADWHTFDFYPMGLWDRCDHAPRVPHVAALTALRRLHRRVERTFPPHLRRARHAPKPSAARRPRPR